jgi:predicted small integral membrane protein
MAELPDIARHVTPIESTARKRRGLLPIKTNAFDRVFIGVVLFVAIHLFWMRFLEPPGLSLYIATAISLVLAVVIVKQG